MTTSKIRKLPAELPHARIYLDDLFEIENIFREELSQFPDAETITYEYEIDRSLTITTRKELEEHGGHTSNFSLNIVSPNWKYRCDGAVSIYNTINPRLSLPSALSSNEWSIFGKIERIFAARKDHLKTLTDAMPIRYLITFSLFSWLPLIANFFLKLIFRITIPEQIVTPYLSILLFIASLLLIIGTGNFRQNRIYLHWIRPNEKEKLAARKERIEKFVWLLIGTLLGVIGTALSNKFKG